MTRSERKEPSCKWVAWFITPEQLRRLGSFHTTPNPTPALNNILHPLQSIHQLSTLVMRKREDERKFISAEILFYERRIPVINFNKWFFIFCAATQLHVYFSINLAGNRLCCLLHFMPGTFIFFPPPYSSFINPFKTEPVKAVWFRFFMILNYLPAICRKVYHTVLIF